MTEAIAPPPRDGAAEGARLHQVVCTMRAFRHALLRLASGAHSVAVRAGHTSRQGVVTWLVSGALDEGDAARGPWDSFLVRRVDDRADDPLERASPVHIGVLEVWQRSGTIGVQGWVRDAGRNLPIGELLPVGPGMHRITLSGELRAEPLVANGPHPAWRLRWTRTLRALGEDAWFRLIDLHVGIVGCGRTGSVVASLVVRCGVRRVTLLDADLVERHNLGEMDVDDEAVGTPKAVAIATRLRATLSSLRPVLLPVVARAGEPVGFAAMRECDILFCCVDDDAARLTVAVAAVRRLQVFFDISTGVFRQGEELGADVRVLLPGERCTLCLGGLAHLPEAVRQVAGAGPDAPRLPTRRLGGVGSLSTVNHIAAAVAVQMLQDLVAERLQQSAWVRISRERGVVAASVVAAPEPSEGGACLCGLAGAGERRPSERGDVTFPH